MLLSSSRVDSGVDTISVHVGDLFVKRKKIIKDDVYGLSFFGGWGLFSTDFIYDMFEKKMVQIEQTSLIPHGIYSIYIQTYIL